MFRDRGQDRDRFLRGGWWSESRNGREGWVTVMVFEFIACMRPDIGHIRLSTSEPKYLRLCRIRFVHRSRPLSIACPRTPRYHQTSKYSCAAFKLAEKKN